MSRPKSKTATTTTTATKVVKKARTSKVVKGTKKISPYNKFMKTELAKVKQTNPGIAHKDAFKMAAQNWGTAPENPKVAAK